MATILKIQRLSGVRYKAIIKQSGRVVTTKTFLTKRCAQTWSKRIESDKEQMEAL